MGRLRMSSLNESKDLRPRYESAGSQSGGLLSRRQQNPSSCYVS